MLVYIKFVLTLTIKEIIFLGSIKLCLYHYNKLEAQMYGLLFLPGESKNTCNMFTFLKDGLIHT